MGPESEVESLSLTTQVVLLGVANCHQTAETPVQTHEVRRVCRTHLEDVQPDVIGTITEADVMRSLYRLEDEGFVAETDTAQPSPTGKGRPAYTLAVEPDEVYAGVTDTLLTDEE